MGTLRESRRLISKSFVFSVVILSVVERVVELKVVVDDVVVGVVGRTIAVVDVVTHSGLCTSPRSLKKINMMNNLE